MSVCAPHTRTYTHDATTTTMTHPPLTQAKAAKLQAMLTKESERRKRLFNEIQVRAYIQIQSTLTHTCTDRYRETVTHTYTSIYLYRQRQREIVSGFLQFNTHLLNLLPDRSDGSPTPPQPPPQEMRGNIRVLCRIRPPKPSTPSTAAAVTKGSSPTEVILRPPGPQPGTRKDAANGKEGGPAKEPPKFFELDGVLGPESTQAAVFAEVQPTVQSVMDGFQVRGLMGWDGAGLVVMVEGESRNLKSPHYNPLPNESLSASGGDPGVRADGLRQGLCCVFCVCVCVSVCVVLCCVCACVGRVPYLVFTKPSSSSLSPPAHPPPEPK